MDNHGNSKIERIRKRKLKRKIRDTITALAISISPLCILLSINSISLNRIERARQDSIRTADDELLYQTVQEIPMAYVFRNPVVSDGENKITDDYTGNYYLGKRLETRGSISNADIGYFYNTLELLPAQFKQYILKSDWRFVLCDQIINPDDTPFFKTNGMTRMDERKVYIDVNSMREDGVILHELGHILYGRGLQDELLKRGIASTVYRELDHIYVRNAHGNAYIYYPFEEMTAQLFDDYCRYPEAFKKQAPTVYEAFDGAIENLKEEREDIYYEIKFRKGQGE